MAVYDYRKANERLNKIINSKLNIIDTPFLPTDDNITFDNAYHCWITSIFVDIRDSSKLFAEEEKENVSKVVKCFSSEIISILKNDNNIREIGIRGDCVYAIYTTPDDDDVYELAQKTFYINTFISLLNELLISSHLHPIEVGIGMSTDKELVISACHDFNGNSKVWIGDAVSKASNLSSLGSKNGNPRIAFSEESYKIIIKKLIDANKDKNPSDWFTRNDYSENEFYYTTSIMKKSFYQWITNSINNPYSCKHCCFSISKCCYCPYMDLKLKGII